MFQYGWKLEKFSLLYDYYLIIDTEEYITVKLCEKYQIRVRAMRQYSKQGEVYKIVLYRCRKKDFRKFAEAMNEMEKRMILCGYRDYGKFCEEMQASYAERKYD